MRFPLCWIACSLLWTTAVAAAPASIPIPNADLEVGTTGPDYWHFGHNEGGTGEWTWDTEHVHSGKRAFRIRKTNVSGYSFLESDFLPVQPGEEYEVSAWIHLNRRSNAGVYFMVSQYTAASGAMQFPNAFSNSRMRQPAGEWKQLRLVFKVRKPNTRVKIHALVAFGVCDVTWDDFRLGPSNADMKPRYEPPTDEVLPPLGPAKAIVAKRPRSVARIEVIDGRPCFVVDGKPTPPCFYVSPFWTPQKAQINDFKQAGVHVYLVPLVLGRGVYGDRGPWLGPHKYDFSEVDDLLWRVLRVDPQGYIIFYMACDPYRTWGEDHPNDVTEDQNGLKAIVDMHPKRWGSTPGPGERYGPCQVSRTLREETAETLKALVRYVDHSEAGKAVIGYHVAGMNDGQWFQWASFDPKNLHLADYCPAAQASFRDWLRTVYGNDVQELRRASHRPDVTFDTASVPTGDRLWHDGFLVNPQTDQDVIDYNRFYSEGIADTVLYLAHTLREATHGNALLSTYYEDITCNSPNHIALGTYLASKDIDFFAGPAAYGVRMPGQCGAVRNVFGSTLLHGKLFLTEEDWRSWHSVPSTPENNYAWGRAETAEAHNAMVRRECGMMLADGMGTWWYDMSGGWFRDDQIMAGITEARRAFTKDLSMPGVPRGDLAIFVSEKSDHDLYAKTAAQVRANGIVQQVYQFNTSGVPYRMYLLSDLGRIKLPEHRMYLFINCYDLDETQRKAIAQLRRDGHLLVFLHAPGIAGATDPAAEISELTGMKVRPAPEAKQLGADPVDLNAPLLKDTDGYIAMPCGDGWPAFAVDDPSATALATYPGTKSVSVAYKRFADYAVLYAGCYDLGDQFIHNLAASAGAWCAAPPGDAVYANGHFLTIHAMDDIDGGHKRLRLAKPSRVTDLTTGKVIAARTSEIDLDMKVGETRWFELEPVK